MKTIKLDKTELHHVYDIINCEGPILSLYKGRGNALYLGATVIHSHERVIFSTTKELLRQYANSQISLHQLYLSSPDFLVKLHDGKQLLTCVKEEFEARLASGETLLEELEPGMVHDKFLKGFRGL